MRLSKMEQEMNSNLHELRDSYYFNLFGHEKCAKVMYISFFVRRPPVA